MKNKMKSVLVIILGLIVGALIAYTGLDKKNICSQITIQPPVQEQTTSQEKPPVQEQTANQEKPPVQEQTTKQEETQVKNRIDSIPNNSSNDLLPDPNQFIMSDDELAAEFKKFQQSDEGSKKTNTYPSGTLSSSDRLFLENQKKILIDEISSLKARLDSPNTMYTLRPSIREAIGKAEKTIEVIEEKLNK